MRPPQCTSLKTLQPCQRCVIALINHVELAVTNEGSLRNWWTRAQADSNHPANFKCKNGSPPNPQCISAIQGFLPASTSWESKAFCVREECLTSHTRSCFFQGNTETKKKKGDIPEKPKGIYTSPAKKGTFGFNKITLSERAGYKGVATE